MPKSIDLIKKQFQDEWVLVDVEEEDALNQPTKGEVIAHSKDRDEIYNKMQELPHGFRVATIFTGEVPPKDMAMVF